MSWRDRLREASFRGVPFLVDDRDLSGGRLRARHVFFRRDLPFLEDLGRRAREYRVNAHLIGDDYDLQRERLAKALEAADAAELVLSHDRPLLAVCTAWRARESVTEAGGIVTLDLTFEERGEVPRDSEDGGSQNRARESARLFRDSAAEAAPEELVAEGVPESVREATADELTALGEVLAGASILEGATGKLAALEVKVAGLISSAADLALDPAQLVVQVRDTLETVLDAASDAVGALHAYRTLFGVERTSGLETGLSAPAVAARENAAAVNRLFRGLALAAATESAVQIAWSSRGEAEGTRAELLGEIDALEADAPEPMFSDLQDLRVAVAEAIPPPNARLPVAIEHELAVTTPALVLAYDLWDDATRDDVVTARNDVDHPGFLPAGEPLEILIRDARNA